MTRTDKLKATLAAMDDWMNLRQLAALTNGSPSGTRKAFAALHTRGLLERRTLTNVTVRHEYRRSMAGSELIGLIEKPAPVVDVPKDNPFNWRTYIQPVPFKADKFPNQHRDVSEKATFWI